MPYQFTDRGVAVLEEVKSFMADHIYPNEQEYNEQLEEVAKEGADAREIFRRIAVRDIQEACDVLRTVWDDAGGADGFVSLEVDPDRAKDTDRTIEQARELWGLVDRPNCMIKIPGTDEGLPAIEEALYEGINVNVTLLFRVEQYDKVMERFISAMERRHEEGKSLDVHSVASFFVSRVDSLVDEKLGDGHELRGKAGLANARNAYKHYQAIFEGERFAKLRDAGCPVQRPLWASTGVKNPEYPPTMYVYGLVAPDTVNTMPLDTLEATADHGDIRPGTGLEDPTADLDALRDAGIDMEDVTGKLLRDGVDKFVTPMEKLLEGLEGKQAAV